MSSTDNNEKFYLLPYESIHREAWNAFVYKSKMPCFLFDRDYMEYHSDRFKDASLIVFKGKEIFALFPCNSANGNIYSHQGLTYGGLIYDIDAHAVEVICTFKIIADYFKERDFKKIVYKAIPYIFHVYPASEDMYALNVLGAKIYRRDISSVIELGKRPKLSDSRKSTARKSEKIGASISILTSDKEVSDFHGLLTSVLGKFNTKPTHSLSELLLLRSRFPENIKIYGVTHQEKLLAGSVIYDFDQVVHTQYLATSEEGKKIGALDFLLKSLIEEMYRDRKYFSFGISTEADGIYLNEGLIRQKEGFGGRGVVNDFYQLEL
ncbi:GNAT family N-acetyltransferase [Chromobacterium violaceum]|uniref:GNAT family N-acetyltransferase n=1 Tax=Chromobacterium violaceum TaxID=536 RepID=UPI0009DAF716|nr:GNAT family N-acetyltransferase [Chromobacterium violaceum]OQS22120.1 GNAT family N-acetyltransferase [Chromobacterium violaceum]